MLNSSTRSLNMASRRRSYPRQAFLASFPAAFERLECPSLMADAYARENDTADEFALYDRQLTELAARPTACP